MTGRDVRHLVWRKSSHTGGGENSMCVEVASMDAHLIAARDSKDPDGPVLLFGAAAWTAFLTRIKRDALR